MSDTVVIVKHVVKYVTCRGCTVCEKPLKGNRLHVRATTVGRKGNIGRPLSFGVGAFCSVSCLMKFAAERKKKKQATVRGWAFGDFS